MLTSEVKVNNPFSFREVYWICVKYPLRVWKSAHIMSITAVSQLREEQRHSQASTTQSSVWFHLSVFL